MFLLESLSKTCFDKIICFINIHNISYLPRSLKELTLCPVCYGSVKEFVQQCEYGHVVCHECRSRLRKCPVCRARFVNTIRNLTLEKVVKLI